MKSLLLFSALCVSYINGYPGASQGVGAYAYQDTTGNRYGGTYDLKDGQLSAFRGDDISHQFNDIDSFFPVYFTNFENLLQEAFRSNIENQKTALNTAKKAYELTSNQPDIMNSKKGEFVPNYANFVPNFGAGYNPFSGGFPGGFFGPDFMSGYGAPNSAVAGAAAGPGFVHQIAAINPGNPQMPNIDIMNRFAETPESGKPQFYSVSSSSFASSSDVNGQPTSSRGAETVVNNNGKITKYSTHS